MKMNVVILWCFVAHLFLVTVPPRGACLLHFFYPSFPALCQMSDGALSSCQWQRPVLLSPLLQQSLCRLSTVQRPGQSLLHRRRPLSGRGKPADDRWTATTTSYVVVASGRVGGRVLTASSAALSALQGLGSSALWKVQGRLTYVKRFNRKFFVLILIIGRRIRCTCQ